MKIDFGKFNIPDKKRQFILSLVFIILLILDFNFVLGLQINAYRKINLKVNKLKKEFSLLKQNLTKMEESLKGSTPEYKRNIKEDEVSLLIENIYKLANQQKIEVIQLIPQREVTKSPSELVSYIFKINLNADFYSLLNFIKALEENNIIITVEGLDINSNPKDMFHHKVELILRTNVKK
ncbi:MAG: hypothetical protein NC900_02220 [Candidatus Omnitrophica bacterium]|nr:hypothetical protein [Candidatus Omnitrophota bacterium]